MCTLGVFSTIVERRFGFTIVKQKNYGHPDEDIFITSLRSRKFGRNRHAIVSNAVVLRPARILTRPQYYVDRRRSIINAVCGSSNFSTNRNDYL